MICCVYSVFIEDINNGWTILLIGRGICGICTGLNSTLIPIYIKEISPDAIRLET